MAKVIGIGGVFFRSKDPAAARAWYQQHLGIPPGDDVMFIWREKDQDQEQRTVWAPFDHNTDYFGPSGSGHMINYIVDDLDGMLAQLRAAGAQVDDKVEEYFYGRFGWATDPEGVRFELWEPINPPNTPPDAPAASE
jgi:catechol 2,3-dioxygenase-like lactoylglutathione lyase family enzyme